MEPYFSIVIPVYNRAEALKKTLASILAQTFQDFELLIVDDGSKDNSFEVAKTYEGSKVKVFQKENGERAAARNFGAAKAAGRYLIFFDSDDLMYPAHLEEVHRYISAHANPEVVYTGFDFRDENGTILKQVLVDNADFKKKLLRDNFLGCNSVTIRSDVFREFWFNENRDLSTAEDKELWLRVASVYRFHSIPKITFAMVEHSGRSMNNLPAEKLERTTLALIEALRGSAAFTKAFGADSHFLFAFEYCLLSSIASAENDKQKARYYLQQALRSSKKVVFTKRFLAASKNYLSSSIKSRSSV